MTPDILHTANTQTYIEKIAYKKEERMIYGAVTLAL